MKAGFQIGRNIAEAAREFRCLLFLHLFRYEAICQKAARDAPWPPKSISLRRTNRVERGLLEILIHVAAPRVVSS